MLADLLGVALHDTDSAIEATQGRTISDVFVEDGEPAFRALERAEVARAVAEESGVLALGGGAPLDPGTERLLSGRRPEPFVVQAEGENALEHMLWAAVYGDFVSLYLALLNGLNPAPVDLVEKFKKALDE